MPDEVVITSGEFVRKGFLAKDLHESLAVESPSSTAQLALEELQIEQSCDFEQQLITALGADGEGTLPATIRQHIRNNTGDSTLLPAMERFHLHEKDDPLGHVRHSLQRITDAAVAPFNAFLTSERPADFMATKSTPWTQQNGMITFTRKATVQVHLQFYVGLSIGEEAEANLQWRLTDSGTNRIVTITPTLHLGGNLAAGISDTISLPSVMFYPEHYPRNTKLAINTGFTMSVKDADATFGRVDNLRISLQRSTWIAKSTTDVYDAVVLFKRTAAGIHDSSNFLELTEL